MLHPLAVLDVFHADKGLQAPLRLPAGTGSAWLGPELPPPLSASPPPLPLRQHQHDQPDHVHFKQPNLT